jgi:PIN domain nuclease of toxin-antitoxin system
MGSDAMIVLDTHVMLWLVSGDDSLGAKSREMIDKAYHDTLNQQLAVSAITFWEVSLLQQKSRIEFNESVSGWRKELLRQGVHEIAVSGEVAVASTNLEDFHADPADRFIVTSAMQSHATLITADKKILNWQGGLTCFDARK